MLMAPSKPQRGMIYLALLLSVALIGGVSAIGLKVAQTIQIRQAEAELLAIGLEFRNALQSYAEATPNGIPPAPESLADLLRDSRYPGIRRHLRRIYYDPLTGKADWGVVRGPDRRIVGIHSLSKGMTIKRDGFPGELAALAGKESHDQWVFAISDIPPVGVGKNDSK